MPLNVLIICTGNICRSPLTEMLLEKRLAGVDVSVASAGTAAREGLPMTEEALSLAVANGVDPVRASVHSSRMMSPARMGPANLVLTAAREHRRQVVELEPSFVSRVFTLLELGRLLDGVDDTSLMQAAQGPATHSPAARLTALLNFASARRGLVPPLATPDGDDIVDPYRRSSQTYEASLRQILKALPASERLLRIAASGGVAAEN